MSQRYDVTIPEHYMQQAREAMRWVQARHPDLSANGWSGGSRNLPDLQEIATALAFIDCSGARVLQKVKHGRSSYGWKHQAEAWGRAIGFAPYVSNGAFIAAALHRNVPIKRFDGSSPNCELGLSQHGWVNWSRLRTCAA